MGGYVLRRTLAAVPVAWAALTLLFLAFYAVPGDPVDVMAGERAVTPAVRAAIEADLGLDQPWAVRYARYWGRLLQGDLGESYRTGRPVAATVGEAAPASLRLAFWALVLQAGMGVAAGVVAAARRSSFVDALSAVSTAVLLAVPAFVLGYVLIYMFGVYTFQHDLPAWARLPVQGVGPDRWALLVIPAGDQWRYLLLPAVTLAAVPTAVLARVVRASLLDVMGDGYVRTAAAIGASPGRVVLRHGLRNALLPAVTLAGLGLADMVGAAVLTETVFNWPGLGSAVANAATALDAPLVLGLSLVLVLTYLLANLAVDVTYAWLDPRIRHPSEAA